MHCRSEYELGSHYGNQRGRPLVIYIDNYAAGFSNLPPQTTTDITGIVVYQNVPFDTNDLIILLPRSSRDIWH